MRPPGPPLPVPGRAGGRGGVAGRGRGVAGGGGGGGRGGRQVVLRRGLCWTERRRRPPQSETPRVRPPQSDEARRHERIIRAQLRLVVARQHQMFLVGQCLFDIKYIYRYICKYILSGNGHQDKIEPSTIYNLTVYCVKVLQRDPVYLQ